MPYLDISKSQFNKMITEFVSEELSTEELHKLVIKLLKEYSKFEGSYFDNIKLFVDKQVYKESKNF